MSNQGASGKRSVVGLLLAAAAGLLLGLIAAWVIWPVRWVDTDPADLRPAHQAIYAQMIADSYALNSDIPLAQERLLQLSRDGTDLAAIAVLVENVAVERQAVGDNASATRLRRLSDDTGLAAFAAAPQSGAPAASTDRSPLPNSVMILLGAGILIIALAAVAGLLLARASKRQADEPELPVFDAGLTPLTTDAEPAVSEAAESAPAHRPSLEEILGVNEPVAPPPVDSDETPQEPVAVWEDEDQEVEVDEELLAPIAAPTAATPPTSPQQSAVLSQFDVAYSYGDDDFYHSVTIDTPDESFVGQCGIVISDVLGSDKAQQVDAFDLWLFETNGTRTISKVLLSPWAAADDGIVARLGRKGETIAVRPGLTITLQAMTLRLTAQVTDLAFQPHAQDADAIFGRLALHIQVERISL